MVHWLSVPCLTEEELGLESRQGLPKMALLVSESARGKNHLPSQPSVRWVCTGLPAPGFRLQALGPRQPLLTSVKIQRFLGPSPLPFTRLC